jgi:NitT/TauT family transport system ATP-binding protein
MANQKNAPLVLAQNLMLSFPDGNGGAKVVLNDVSLNLHAGEIVGLVGPSGCGKTTLLKMILGSLKHTGGRILFNGNNILGVDRHRGLVPQNSAVLPHLTVRENIAIGLETERVNLVERLLRTPRYRRVRATSLEEADGYLKIIGFTQADGDKYPKALSGGMRQRVAIAQSMIMKPQVLLMDEPFSALDPMTRVDMQVFLLEQWENYRPLIILVTHSLTEAAFVGTRLVALSTFYSDDDGKSNGARVVVDAHTPGHEVHPKPTTIRDTAEFRDFVAMVERDAMKPEHRQHISKFNRSHANAQA